MLPAAEPDGERILTWRQVYDLPDLPERLVVVGSGVTGAEFAGAFQALGSQVTLVSSRERVLPGEDPDAADVIEDVFARRGMTVVKQARATAVERTDDGVVVRLEDGRTVEGSHALMCLGSVPSTSSLGLADAGVDIDERGFITVDRVSRTSDHTVYAAGDCTGVLDAGLGRRHAGPDRDVARARRGGRADPAVAPCRPRSSPTRRSRRSG